MQIANEQLAQDTDVFLPPIHAYEAVQLSTEQPVDLSEREPLLSAEEAEEVFGFPSGPLQAVIRLPYKLDISASIDPRADYVDQHDGLRSYAEEGRIGQARRRDAVSVYCFKAPEPRGRHHRPDAAAPRFYLMGIEQIGQLRDAARGGKHELPEVGDGVLELSPGKHAAVGRASWLPGIGKDVALLQKDEELRDAFQSVSRYQARVSESPDGRVLVGADEYSYSENAKLATVEVGKPLARPEGSPSRRRVMGGKLLRKLGVTR